MIEDIFKTLPKRELAKSLVDLGFDKYEKWQKESKAQREAMRKESEAKRKETEEIKKQLAKLLTKLEE